MPSVLEKLDAEIKEALKARQQDRLATLRLIKTTVKNKEIELIRPLTEAEFLGCLTSMAKQRNDSITQFKQANRQDLVDKEETELKIIESYLPQALTDEELTNLIAQAKAETKASSAKDMGLLMKALKDKTAGRVDGKVLADKVKAALS